MRFDIITLFPELISGYFKDSLIKRALDKNILQIEMHQLRDFATDKHHQVDDSPFGGGAGMLLKPDVLGGAMDHVLSLHTQKPLVVYLSPQGEKLSNVVAKELSKAENIVLVCGRYEGVDHRFIELYVDREISIGDYVLSGGELAAAVVIDAVSRFIPGVVGREDSVLNDTFENSTLKYPQYTRPRVYKGFEVPEVLMSGNHADIEKWRKEQSIKVTKKKRGDLL
jgi:tRNA (guanine37-N1)-methyltransferase